MAYCEQCGAQTVNGVCPNCGAAAYQNSASYAQPAPANQNNGFVSPDEKVICTIGNGYAQNFFAGGVLKKGFAALTNKRFYFNGRVYTGIGFKMLKTKQIIDLETISGTCVLRRSNLIAWMFFAALWLLFSIGWFVSSISPAAGWGIIPLLLAVIFVVCGIFSIKYTLCVEYTGGRMAFTVGFSHFNECQNFMQQLHLAKEKLIKEKQL